MGGITSVQPWFAPLALVFQPTGLMKIPVHERAKRGQKAELCSFFTENSAFIGVQ